VLFAFVTLITPVWLQWSYTTLFRSWKGGTTTTASWFISKRRGDCRIGRDC